MNQNKVYDFAWIHSAKPSIICIPTSTYEIKNILQRYPNHKVSIAGGKYSHGGQTMFDGSIYLDFKEYKHILDLNLNTEPKSITVQAGATWEQLIKYLDGFNLSVSEMQSYYNFTVGGSISVNCHGRGLLYGTVGDSVLSLKVLTVDGHELIASREINFDLFQGIIGGYGGIAIILEATLLLTDNYPIERKVTIMKRNELNNFYKDILKQPSLVFYNSNIYPTHDDQVVNISWYKSKGKLTDEHRIEPKQSKYFGSMLMEQLLRRNILMKYVRAKLEPEMLLQPKIVMRNNEIASDVNKLQPLIKYPTTTILQEYFVPINQIRPFLDYFWVVIGNYQVNLLNLSLRYVKRTSLPILNYAPDDRISVVLYLNLGNNKLSLSYCQKWTQLITQRSIDLGGSYYLPYLLLATKEQFRLAYPNYKIYMAIKHKYDPNNRLCNQLLDTYLKY